MDCNTVRLLLEFYRPRSAELDSDEVLALESHLAHCPDCDALARSERLTNLRFSQAMRDVPLPEGLQNRLLSRLASDRRAAAFRRAGWAVPRAAVAAVLLLALFLGWFWWQSHPPVLNLEAQRDAEWEKMISPRPDGVEEWFRSRYGLAMVAPLQFDYSNLAWYGMGECQGRRVPQLVFARADICARATVFVVTRQQFNLDALPEDPGQFDTAGFHVQIWRDADRSDTAYIIIYTGDDLAPLLANGHAPV